MKAFQPYLNFQGNTREAMTFYRQCIDGELFVQTAGEMQLPPDQVDAMKKNGETMPPPPNPDFVIHARLTKGPAVIMASDAMPDAPFTVGNNVWVNIDCDSIAEIEKVFAAFSEGGHVIMPLADQFWNARYGMLTDKFGINWMFNCELPK
ncbi:MAG: VOC family protein [Gemmatimonadaceae bacterium]